MKFYLTKTLNHSIICLACMCLLIAPPLVHAAKAVIITTGSGYLMAGFAGDTKPKVEIPSSAFMPKGTVTDWNKFEKAIAEMYQKLGVKPTDQPVLVTDDSLNHKDDRGKTAQIMFDKFNVPAYNAANNPVFAAFAVGRQNSALILRIEGGKSQVAPVYEGSVLPHAVLDMDPGKQEADQKSPADPMQALFDPSLIGKDLPGIGMMVHESIMKTDVDLRHPMYENIVLCGVGSLYEGIKDKLTTAVIDLAPSSARVTVHAPADRRILAWKGASKLVGEGMFESFWIKQAEYEKSGLEIIHRKGF